MVKFCDEENCLIAILDGSISVCDASVNGPMDAVPGSVAGIPLSKINKTGYVIIGPGNYLILHNKQIGSSWSKR